MKRPPFHPVGPLASLTVIILFGSARIWGRVLDTGDMESLPHPIRVVRVKASPVVIKHVEVMKDADNNETFIYLSLKKITKLRNRKPLSFWWRKSMFLKKKCYTACFSA